MSQLFNLQYTNLGLWNLIFEIIKDANLKLYNYLDALVDANAFGNFYSRKTRGG